MNEVGPRALLSILCIVKTLGTSALSHLALIYYNYLSEITQISKKIPREAHNMDPF